MENIARELAELEGVPSLANELIQNADDAVDASRMRFDVRDDALGIWNDGRFTRCGDIVASNCSGIDGTNHLCDFHRFRLIGSGDKRKEADTTGAFGIGFTAVYQVTDHPELTSSGERWRLDELAEPARRVWREDAPPDHSGTTVQLPWAFDSNSPFRAAVRQPALDSTYPQVLLEELVAVLPAAMLFLKKLRAIEVLRNGRRVFSVERRPSGDSVEIACEPGGSATWLLLRSDFESAAIQLRETFPGVIEDHRSSQVVVALSESAANHGWLFATLATQESSQLPLHIQADFFPRSDRKSVHLDVAGTKSAGYQVQWNRAALSAAATAIAEHLDQLPDLLGFVSTWDLLVAAYRLHAAVDNGDVDLAFASFWNSLEGPIADALIVRTTTGERSTPAQCRLLEDPGRERPAREVLELLGIPVVDDPLRNLCFQLRIEATGLKVLSLDDITKALVDRAMTGATTDSSPAPLDDPQQLAALWREVDILLGRGSTSAASRARFRDIAIAPALDGALVPFTEAFRADDDPALLFMELDAPIAFLDEDRIMQANAGGTAGLCDMFDVELAVSRLETMDPDQLAHTLDAGTVQPRDLLTWLSRQPRVREFGDRLRALPLYPSPSGVKPLDALVIPGDFEDPLDLTSTAQHEQVHGLVGFLESIGAERLTFPTYVERFVPEYFEGKERDAEKTRSLVALVARRFGEIRDDTHLRLVLRAQPLVECEDGEFRAGAAAYFRTDLNEAVLGDSVAYAATPREHREAIDDLYASVGVHAAPTPEAILDRCRALAGGPVLDETVRAVEEILLHVARTLEEPGKGLGPFAPLADLAWLPLEGDAESWHAPNELDTTFARHVHETTGAFIALPQPSQGRATALLGALGVRTGPTPEAIVDHLLNCVRERVEVHRDVYRRLNDRADDPAVERLRETRCLLLENGEYVRPDQVFWGDHSFGHFRYRLGDGFVQYQNLLAQLGVKPSPDPEDAVAVLADIGAAFHRAHHLIDDDSRAVIIECWRMLSEALDTESLDAAEVDALRRLPAIPNRTGKLRPPNLIFFDNWSYLAGCFEEALSHDFIKRPTGAWSAMAAVGVEDLTDAVTTEIVELEGERPDEQLAAHIRSRHRQLSRVIEMRGSDVRARLETMLYGLEVVAVSRLLVTHTLEIAGRRYGTGALHMPAIFIDPTLHYMADTSVPWSSIAREIVRGLLPREEPGDLASTIQLILTAGDAAVADENLDELGFPRIDQSVYAPNSAATVNEIGGSDQVPSHDDAAWQAPATSPVDDQEDEPMPASSQDSEALGRDYSRAPGSEEPGHPGPKQAKSIGGRFVGKSFVEPATTRQGAGQAEASGQGGETERAAVDAALRFERIHGREPREMPPLNPGYDIESGPPGAEPDRFIEVKGTAMSWAQTGVEITPRQFETAREKGDQFWLYVVDDAPNDELRALHSIRNPAQQIERYVFDDGWRSAAEQVWRPLPEPPEVVLEATPPEPEALPFFGLDTEGIGEPGFEAGYLLVGGRRHPDGSFVVQLRDDALGAFGHFALIEPANDDPDDGALLVDLRKTDLRLPCPPVTSLRVKRNGANDGFQYSLDLGVMGVETVDASVWQRIRVLGRIRDTWSAE